MRLHDAMIAACDAVGIEPPRGTQTGRWLPCQVRDKRRGNSSGRVLIFEDSSGGIARNWVTGARQVFRPDGTDGVASPAQARKNTARERQRARASAQAQARDRAEVARICETIVAAARSAPHDYLRRKGFPDASGLVIDDIFRLIPDHPLGRRIERAIRTGFPSLSEGPLLIVPGRINGRISTVQMIAADGSKRNILGGAMSGAYHRISTGPLETWVCEGIATALSVRAALRLLNRSATVLCAFAATNVAKVARDIPRAIIAADNDRPIADLHGMGTGAFHAAATGHVWTMPPERGDFNDMHMRDGLRAVALHFGRMPAM